jgi:hypothetical protein
VSILEAIDIGHILAEEVERSGLLKESLKP